MFGVYPINFLFIIFWLPIFQFDSFSYPSRFMYTASYLIWSYSFYECYVLMPLSISTLLILKQSSNYSITFTSSENNFCSDVYFLGSSLAVDFCMHFRIMDHRLIQGENIYIYFLPCIVVSFFLQAPSSLKSYDTTSKNVLGPMVGKQLS